MLHYWKYEKSTRNDWVVFVHGAGGSSFADSIHDFGGRYYPAECSFKDSRDAGEHFQDIYPLSLAL